MPRIRTTAMPTLRFAHPFFTPQPPATRRPAAGLPGVARMTDYIKKHLEPIPKPRGKSVMTLADVIGAAGADQIKQSGAIIIHALGDTGHGTHTMQEDVADQMTTDYQPLHPDKSPAFLFHMGDVIYFKNDELGYREQFYAPYKRYPGKIVAIPGNHDGEVGRGRGQTKTLEAFLENFCRKNAEVPPAADGILRQMVPQPGVYWQLEMPFLDIVGLYSNVAENPGFISAPDIGDAQKKWLVKTLTAIRKKRANGPRKALIIAAHHPPYSSGGHSGSEEMKKDIDDACQTAGVLPDAFLAAHAHNYQRHMRLVQSGGKTIQIPYIVAGTGGRGITPITQAANQTIGDHIYAKSYKGFGYLVIRATTKQLAIGFRAVPRTAAANDDSVTIQL
jgi:hypothetical protein